MTRLEPGGEAAQSAGQESSASKLTSDATPRKLQYLPAFRYVFDHPEWLPTLLLTSVCSFIPVLGHIALYGYCYEITESLFRHPGRLYPKFAFQRFGEYCTRGVWVYILGLLIGGFLYLLVWIPLQLVFQFGIIFLLQNARAGAIVLSIAAPLVLIYSFLLVLFVIVVTTPFLLRAGLTQEFPLTFKFPWVKDYLRKMWLDVTLATLLVMVTAPILFLLGCAALGLGFFVAPILVLMLSAHLSSQLYLIYLERGGEPIPLRPLPAEVPPLPSAPENSPAAATP